MSSGRGHDSDLVRGVRRWDLLAITLNTVIGAGIFGLPSRIYALSGVYSVLAIVASALLASLRVLCYAEAGSRYPETGGAYLYAVRAFGQSPGFVVGLLIWFGQAAGGAAVASLLPDYMGYFWPAASSGAWRVALIAGGISMLTLVNIVGVRRAALLSDVLALVKLAPLAALVVVGIVAVSPAHFSATHAPDLSGFSRATLLLVFAFAGFGSSVVLGGETRDAQRNVPFAVLSALAIVTVLYVLIQVVCIGTVPALGQSARPLADAAEHLFGPAGGKVVAAGALVAVLGTLHGLILIFPRVLLAMAFRRQMPRQLTAVHPRFRTPHRAILLSATVMLVLALSGTFTYAVTVGSIALLLANTSTCIAMPVLRVRDVDHPARFLVPGGWFVPAAAVALCGWLLAASPWRELTIVLSAAGLGWLAYYFAQRLFVTSSGSSGP